MPPIIIAGGIAAGAGIASSIISSNSASSEAEKQRQAAQAAGLQAQTNAVNGAYQSDQAAQRIINSPAAQAANDQIALQNAFAQNAGQYGNQGLANQQSAYNQLQGIANGTGPNPALAQLNQSTGQNIAAQSALMAGQRGAGANAGLIARQAAQQGGNLQQQAIGQGATLAANQQLAATGQLAGVAGQQVNQGINAQGNATQAALQSQAFTQQALSQASAQANQGYNNATNVLAGANLNAAQQSAAADRQAAQTTTNAIGGIASGVGSAIVAQGAKSPPPPPTPAAAQGGLVPDGGPRSRISKHFQAFAKGGQVQALVSPGERYLTPEEVKKVAEGKKSAIQAGQKIPGKAPVKGDSYQNDIVAKTLQAGGIVLPRHITEAKDPAKAAHKFVTAILSKKGLK